MSSSPVKEKANALSHEGSFLNCGASVDAKLWSNSPSFSIVRSATTDTRCLILSAIRVSSVWFSSMAAFMATCMGSWAIESSSVLGRSARKILYWGKAGTTFSQMFLASSLSAGIFLFSNRIWSPSDCHKAWRISELMVWLTVCCSPAFSTSRFKSAFFFCKRLSYGSFSGCTAAMNMLSLPVGEYSFHISSWWSSFNKYSASRVVDTVSSSTISVGGFEKAHPIITGLSSEWTFLSAISSLLWLKKVSSASNIDDFPTSFRPIIAVICSIENSTLCE